MVPFKWKLNPDLQRENIHSANVSSIEHLSVPGPALSTWDLPADETKISALVERVF